MTDYSYGTGVGSGPLSRTGVGAGTGIGARIIRAGSFIPTSVFLVLYAAALPKIVIPIIMAVAIVARTRLLALPLIAGVLWVGAFVTCVGLLQVLPPGPDIAAILPVAHSLAPDFSYTIMPPDERLATVALCLLAIWICVMTLATWAIFRWDKHRAGYGWTRVSERCLLALAALGGVLGAIFGVYGHYHRHKAQKRTFMFVLMVISGIYVGLGVLVFHLGRIPIYQ